jgi:hypothetical protein
MCLARSRELAADQERSQAAVEMDVQANSSNMQDKHSSKGRPTSSFFLPNRSARRWTNPMAAKPGVTSTKTRRSDVSSRSSDSPVSLFRTSKAAFSLCESGWRRSARCSLTCGARDERIGCHQRSVAGLDGPARAPTVLRSAWQMVRVMARKPGEADDIALYSRSDGRDVSSDI